MEEVWGLYDDGWALASTDEGCEVFPVWPREEYAAMCAIQDWAGYTPKSISLDEFMDDLLPGLKEDGIVVGVFPTPNEFSVQVSVDEVLAHLHHELEKC